MPNSKRDINGIPALQGVNSLNGALLPLKINPATGGLLIDGDSLFTDLDARYLRISNNLSDVTAATARTNLGLVAGGAGDIWVEKAGDTMTNDLTLSAAKSLVLGNALNNNSVFLFNNGATGVGLLYISDFSGGSMPIFLDGKLGVGTSTPAEKLNVIGNFRIDDNATPTKGYRFRTSGSGLDIDYTGVGKTLFLSGYNTADYTGTQVQFFEASAEFSFIKFYQKSIWINSTSGDGMVWDRGANKLQILASNIETDTATGMKIGTATTQKVGFFNATPIVQVPANTDLGTVLSNLGLRAAGTAYPITTSGAVALSGAITITDVDIALGTGTGTKIGTATNQKLGFYNATPIVRGTAFTQTFATASHTVPAATQLAAPAGGTGATAGAYDTAANRNLMITSVNAARTDIDALKQSLNGLIDDLQALGLIA